VELGAQAAAFKVLRTRYPVDPPPFAVFSECADAIYDSLLNSQ
jgi:hypothetical protein